MKEATARRNCATVGESPSTGSRWSAKQVIMEMANSSSSVLGPLCSLVKPSEVQNFRKRWASRFFDMWEMLLLGFRPSWVSPCMPPSRAIEVSFPAAEVSRAAAAALQRKELKDPVNHAHRWWGRRPAVVMGAVVRAALAQAGSDPTRDPDPGQVVLDPMMGAGTTVSVARALGLRAVGQDINPVAYRIVQAVHSGADLARAAQVLAGAVQEAAQALGSGYCTRGPAGEPGELICYLWGLRVRCPTCREKVEVRTQIQIGSQGAGLPRAALCLRCFARRSDPESPCACGARDEKAGQARCPAGHLVATSRAALESGYSYQIVGKVLRRRGGRDYCPADEADKIGAARAEAALLGLQPQIPVSPIPPSETTAQVLAWGCRRWCDLYLPRQLAALGLVARAVSAEPEPVRSLLALALSSAAEFNCAMASYRGESQGAIRPAFWAQILRLEPVVAEAPLLSLDPAVSGSLLGIFRRRILPAAQLAQQMPGSVSLRLGSSHCIDLPDQSASAVVTDPPFGDSINYDHLADFFNAWHRVLYPDLPEATGSPHQVQDGGTLGFARSLGAVLRECGRILVPGGVAAYTFTHGNPTMWVALARAAEAGGMRVVRSHLVLTDAAFSAISYRNSDRPQTNAVLVLRRAEEVAGEPGELEAVLQSISAEAAEQLAEVGSVCPTGPADALNAVMGCLVARMRDLPAAQWEAAGLRAQEMARDLPRSQPAAEPERQLTLFQ